jgi:CheY-like chemotaxis protein
MSTTILLIDGRDADTQQFVRNWLCERGLYVSTATDAGRAVERITDFTTDARPDVVLLTAPITTTTASELRRTVAIFSAEAGSEVVEISAGARPHSKQSINNSLEKIFGTNIGLSGGIARPLKQDARRNI